MRVRMLLTALLLISLACPAAAGEPDSSANAAAALSQSAAPPAAVEMPSASGLLVRLGFSLIVVIVLIWGAMYVLRRISGRGAASAGKSRVRVLERTYIAPKKAVYVIQVGSRALAVGVTEAGMATLAELDPDETLGAYPALQERGIPSPFAHLLEGMRSRFQGRDAVGGGD